MSKKLFRYLMLGIGVLSVAYAGVSVDPESVEEIWIEVDRPHAVVEPFKITEIGANGERGLWIAPRVGRGWKGEAGGSAEYVFYAPRDGQYTMWAYCLWHDECTNAIYARIDEMKTAIVGNDPLFNEWHWVKGFSVDLAAGRHVLHLSNHSDNLAVLKVFLTNSSSLHPDNSSTVFSDLFYDGFDGCDDGNFVEWRADGGQWRVFHPEHIADGSMKVLAGSADDGGLFVLRREPWQEYLLSASVRDLCEQDAGNAVGVCFGVTDQGDYHAVRWRGSDRPNVMAAELIRKTGDDIEVLARFLLPWPAGAWQTVEVAVDEGHVDIGVGGERKRRIAFAGAADGGIALVLFGQAAAEFDNIRVRTPEPRSDGQK